MRDRLIELLSGCSLDTDEDARYVADKLIAADVAPVVHGRWEKFYKTIHGVVISEDVVCSNCRKEAEILQNGGGVLLLSEYCPNCGAKMDGERKDGDG